VNAKGGVMKLGVKARLLLTLISILAGWMIAAAMTGLINDIIIAISALLFFLIILYQIKTKEFFSPISLAIVMWLFFFIWFINPYAVDIHGIHNDQKAAVYIMSIALIGIISYLVGTMTFLFFQNTAHHSTNTFERTIESDDLNKIFRSSMVATLIGLCFSIPTYILKGIPLLDMEAMNLSRRALVSDISPYVYYQWYFFEIGVIISFYGYIMSWIRSFKIRFMALLAINLLMLSLVASRVTIGTAIFYMVVLWHFVRRRNTFLQVIVTLGFALLIASGFWILRTTGGNQAFIYGIELDISTPLSALEALLKGFTIFMISPVQAFSYLATHDIHMYGSISFMSFIQALPGKQHEVGLYAVSELLGKDSHIVGGTTVTLIGGLYTDFGWIGLIIGMGFLGFILSYLYKRVISDGSLYTVGLYMIVLVYYFAMSYGGQFLDVSLVWKILLWIAFNTYIKWGRFTYTTLGKISTAFVALGVLIGIFHIFKI
jgi:oligosaccharide repeat unit polymerase